ncbi:uncharacterized protein LOC143301354 [Babylonia areolata]|uniref:uncharacterized protein LOC143301354 n=1 Tax=Babylonia areolata TaxID=304850 RepID=UPI003FD0D0AE
MKLMMPLLLLSVLLVTESSADWFRKLVSGMSKFGAKVGQNRGRREDPAEFPAAAAAARADMAPRRSHGLKPLEPLSGEEEEGKVKLCAKFRKRLRGQTSAREMRLMMKDADANKDGKVDEEEGNKFFKTFGKYEACVRKMMARFHRY